MNIMMALPLVILDRRPSQEWDNASWKEAWNISHHHITQISPAQRGVSQGPMYHAAHASGPKKIFLLRADTHCFQFVSYQAMADYLSDSVFSNCLTRLALTKETARVMQKLERTLHGPVIVDGW
jgi:hypothetical protein